VSPYQSLPDLQEHRLSDASLEIDVEVAVGGLQVADQATEDSGKFGIELVACAFGDHIECAAVAQLRPIRAIVGHCIESFR
jgi:hypothetical protein